MTNGLGLGNAYSYCETKGGIKGKGGKKHEARCGYFDADQESRMWRLHSLCSPLNCDTPK